MYSGIPFPDIDPVAVHLGIIDIRWYSLAYIFGLIISWFLARKMSVKSHSQFTVLKIDDFLIWATFGIIIGGRLGYVLFYNLLYFLEYPLQIFALWEGGMSFHGGLLGVIFALVLFSYRKRVPLFAMGDIIACVAPVGLFLGRLANFINGELYGRISHTVPWVMVFPGGGPEPRHPSQLYEACFEGIILFTILNLLWWCVPKYQKRTGFITGLFFVFYGVFRFGLEFFREPDAHLGFIIQNLSMGQILCVPMVLFGLLIILRSRPATVLKKAEKLNQ